MTIISPEGEESPKCIWNTVVSVNLDLVSLSYNLSYKKRIWTKAYVIPFYRRG